MIDSHSILLRMRDVAFALEAAGSHRRRLNRIGLQKFIYLYDAVSTLYETFPPVEGHYTYKHGPYDPAIQNAVDSLAFRGFVHVHGVERDNEGNVSATYGLTASGSNFTQELAMVEPFQVRWRIAVDVAAKVNARGWGRLKELAYSEPTYAMERIHGFGRRLKPEDRFSNSTASLLEIFKRTLRAGFKDVRPSNQVILELFFRYLENYAHYSRRPSISVSSPSKGA